jgi:hypothetical protein
MMGQCVFLEERDIMRSTTLRGRSHRGFRPRVESLENRLCLSVTVTTVALHHGNELKIVGDSAADTVNISDQGNGHVDVTDGGGNALGSADDVHLIKFEGADGTDTVNYTLVNTLTHSEAIELELGSGGGGTADLDLSKGVTGANLRVGVEGNTGDDSISVTLGSLSAAHVGLYLDGGAGSDDLSVTGAAANISADSALRMALYGGRGDDSITGTFDGQILGRFSYDASGGSGDDTIVGNITIDSGSTGKVHAAAGGGGGNNQVTLNVIDNSGGAGSSTLAKLHATIFDFHGTDTLVHTDNVTVVTGKGHQHGDHEGHEDHGGRGGHDHD